MGKDEGYLYKSPEVYFYFQRILEHINLFFIIILRNQISRCFRKYLPSLIFLSAGSSKTFFIFLI